MEIPFGNALKRFHRLIIPCRCMCRQIDHERDFVKTQGRRELRNQIPVRTMRIPPGASRPAIQRCVGRAIPAGILPERYAAISGFKFGKLRGKSFDIKPFHSGVPTRYRNGGVRVLPCQKMQKHAPLSPPKKSGTLRFARDIRSDRRHWCNQAVPARFY